MEVITAIIIGILRNQKYTFIISFDIILSCDYCDCDSSSTKVKVKAEAKRNQVKLC